MHASGRHNAFQSSLVAMRNMPTITELQTARFISHPANSTGLYGKKGQGHGPPHIPSLGHLAGLISCSAWTQWARFMFRLALSSAQGQKRDGLCLLDSGAAGGQLSPSVQPGTSLRSVLTCATAVIDSIGNCRCAESPEPRRTSATPLPLLYLFLPQPMLGYSLQQGLLQEFAEPSLQLLHRTSCTGSVS